MTMPHPGSAFRRRTLIETLARALPRDATMRRRLLRPYERVLGWWSGGLRAVLPGGEVVLVAPEYRHMTWNPDEYEAFRASSRPGQIVLDIGANVGCYSLLFGKWGGRDGRVYAFEPDPRAFAGLTRHVALNGLTDRIIAVQHAVADRCGDRLPFTVSETFGVSRLGRSGYEADNTIEVQTTSVDEFCGIQGIRPDIIKIDVEGAELGVLRGARRTIAAVGRDLHLYVEMHPSVWSALGMSIDEMRRECDALGMIPERLDGSHDNLWAAEGVCLRLRPSLA